MDKSGNRVRYVVRMADEKYMKTLNALSKETKEADINLLLHVCLRLADGYC